MSKKMLITGITGMIGTHFASMGKKLGYEVFGMARSSAASRAAYEKESNIFRSDILDFSAFSKIVEKIKPDLIIHMAAQAFNGLSWEVEELTHRTNYFGTLHVLKACQMHVPKSKVLLACSSAEYGVFEEKDCPLNEERLLRPITPYGVSKVGTETLGFQYFKNYNLSVYLPRLFIHVGTGHPPATAIQNFARQLAGIKKGLYEPSIKVGNLSSSRDFIDVRDGVDAMFKLLNKGNPGEPYNICTNKAYKISDILDKLIKISGLKVKVVKDKTLFRVSDEPVLLGDNSKIKKLGWKQQYSIDQTLTAVYQDWLRRI